MNNEGMDKYGVDEGGEEKEKVASKGCPNCGAPADKLIKHGHVVACPNCGTEPFEANHR